MPELTSSERRSLALAALLVVLGAGARWGLEPGPAAWAWEAAGPRPGPDGLDSLRAAVEEGVARARRAALPLAPGERIDPNRAPRDELERLPGIGPATARRIEEERRRRPFLRAEELERVRGIGPATLARMRPHLALPPRPPAADARPSLPPSGSVGGRGEPSRRIDVNRARAEELERLPEVGPAIARRIVRSRELHGPFRSLDDLLRVPGIGPARLDALRSRATAGGG